MPPILTYSFLPGLVGSSASLHSSLAYHRCVSGDGVGWRAYRCHWAI